MKQENSDHSENVHKFPDDKVRKALWKSKILCKNWNVTENSGVCEKHFLPTDYATERIDQQTRRIIKKKEKHWYIDG